MNKNYKILIVFFILFCFLIPTNLVNGATDINYTFDDNVLIDSAITDFDDTFNVKDSSYYTQHYNGTYSFQNDIIGSNPLGWIITPDTNCNAIINEGFNGHNKILEIYDNSTSLSVSGINDFNQHVQEGTIEFWYSLSTITGGSNRFLAFYLRDHSDIEIIRILFSYLGGDNIQYWNGSDYLPLLLGALLPYEWFHFRIDFNTDTDTFDCYFNSLLILDDIPFITNTNEIDKIAFLSRSNSDANYSHYFDAIGYSWELEYIPNYTFTFNELTTDTEFSTIGIYSNWSYTKDANTDIYVRDATPIDNEFLRFQDDNNNGYPDLRIPLIESISSINSFYFRTNDITKESYIFLQDGINDRIFIYVSASNLNIYDGITPTVIMAISNDVWYNISISYDCFTDTSIVYVDSILKGTYDFYDNSITIDYIDFRTDLFDDNDYYIDIDTITNIPFSNYLYEIDDNLLPYLNYTGFNEVNRFEFALESVNELYTIGSSDYPLGWSEGDSGGHNSVQVIANPYNSYDRAIEIDTYNIADTKNLRGNFDDITTNFVNITCGFEISTMTGSSSYYALIIESSDLIGITAFIWFQNGTMLYNSDISTSIPLRDDIVIDTYYEFNLLLNYEFNNFTMLWFIDGVYDTSYSYPLWYEGKNGLYEVLFLTHWDDNKATWFIDYCGIYDNGKSKSSEYGYTVYNTAQDWNTQIHNLLFLKANGTFDIGIVIGSYTVGMSMTTFRSVRNYYNSIHTINGYDSADYLTNATIVFTLQNHYFNISTFKIDGVLLKEGANEYSLELEHSGVDIDESYFYVDTSNKLQFRHIANDTNLEYIQAKFNINDVNSSDYAISFKSDMIRNAYGYVRINYTDTSTIIQIPYSSTTTRFLLVQDNFVRDIIILITDKDNNVITGLTTGFIHEIQLIDVISLSVGVITESLLNMIIPLIVILIPTLLFSSRFGKNVIIPLFILFSLILTVSGIIPYWLFFIIIFPSIVMVLFKSKSEVV